MPRPRWQSTCGRACRIHAREAKQLSSSEKEVEPPPPKSIVPEPEWEASLSAEQCGHVPQPGCRVVGVWGGSRAQAKVGSGSWAAL